MSIYLLGLIVLWGRAYLLYRQISKHTVLDVRPIYNVHAYEGVPPDTLLSETGKSIRRRWSRAVIIAAIWSVSFILVQWTAENLPLFF